MRAAIAMSIALGLGAAILIPPAGEATEIITDQRVVSPDRLADAVAVRDVTTEDGAVRGVLVNRSGKTLRDVQLLVRHEWLWRNEFRPGDSDPGRAEVHAVAGPIAPGSELPFTYTEPPLPERTDGRFRTSVEVVALTEIGQ
jgi:hypothetical protein